MRHTNKGRRPRPRVRRYETLPVEHALKILELLASQPAGLTVPEIAASIQRPAPLVIRTIAAMQRRQWLRTDPRGERLTVGQRVLEMTSPTR